VRECVQFAYRFWHVVQQKNCIGADAVKPIPPTSGAELEEALQQLDAKKQAWVDLQDAEKAKLLRRCIACTVAVRHLIESHMTARP
jgi:hypothetical protein